jgi:hydrogenase expression/formation protein HypC
MCVAVNGKLIEKQGDRGKVNVRGNVITVELGVVDAEVGDCVLVHAGCAIARVSMENSEDLDALFEEIGL